MSLILPLATIYLIISMIVLINNVIKKYQCKYFRYRLRHNQISQKLRKNHNYKQSILDLLKSAKIPTAFLFTTAKSITNSFTIDKVCDELEDAEGVFYNRACRFYQWGYKIIKQTLGYSPTESSVLNLFIKVFIFLTETLIVYLLCLWLDTTGIGHKTLSVLIDVAEQLFAH